MNTSLYLNDLLAPYQIKVNDLLQTTIETMGPKTPLRDACEYALCSPAKRLRPCLVLMIGEAINPELKVDHAAISVECCHTASLIADDLPCMDDEVTRRGRPATHRTFGEAVAILASYALIAAAYEHIALNTKDLKGSPGPWQKRADEIGTEALAAVCESIGLRGTTGGQFVDLSPEWESDALIVAHKKTGTLFEIAFVLGWLYSAGDERKLPLAKQAACHLGLIFQICDDWDDQICDREKGALGNVVLSLGEKRTMALLHEEMNHLRSCANLLKINQGSISQLIEFFGERISCL